MALTIHSDEAGRLAAEPARLTGESLPDAVTSALRERLERERTRRDPDRIAAALLELGDRYAALPDRDTRSPDAILGYDEDGAPAR
ncbi:type II toxin-antitoxin system VapB family antitoxin [Azospirillum halopraeferens]|uniref:type II toxin-antitoxin system VapB family antitoxin n=1 Tax=Azospirillum halopraeferens TaxID=34010 RepID=UPI00040E5B95|nr:type II toxin-antitoxin system VapB family antitoxin [Azospirillum halopraeferens]